MKCNGKCFNCKFKDCVATYQEISKLDRLERQEEKKKYLENLEVEISECEANRKSKIDRKRTKRAG